ncbi:SDR family NAD(P)-dependent oxidoreductase [Variovorax sp. EL159]|uniref:SDR family NAD(P)-dependent oxidoreductase n=1 Tax=Variovorax sp. EL159 TaxID=1566270 RepID=UPI00088FF04E|nr:SDR family oxidoreductase [Variovorax sp. EL159]SCX72597.1 2,3-dihydro-2,3-dihydroxybenzoate dehydrogenase [Variovorax sp. EL159]
MSGNSFEGKTLLLVGAGAHDGIGYATAKMLAERGADVALADLDVAAVNGLSGELPRAARHSAHAVDIGSEQSVKAMMEAVMARHGRIDGVAICAGIYARDSFLETSLATWNRVFTVNATGTFLIAQAVARQLVAQGGGGRIVAVASIGGRAPQLTAAAYGASKAAVIQLGRYMALELAQHNITVNVLCPGSTATAMMGVDPVRHAAAVRGNLDQWRLGIPLGHMAEARDQAAAIAFLLSDDARHITGQTMTVDGGQTFL